MSLKKFPVSSALSVQADDTMAQTIGPPFPHLVNEPDNPFNLPMPPRPDGAEPHLQPGWQWVHTDWLAYWLMTRQGINNRKKHLELPETEILAHFEALKWWQNDPQAQRVYAEILGQADQALVKQNLKGWCSHYGLDNVCNSPMPEYEEGPTRWTVLWLYVADKHLRFSLTTGLFGNGRHRVYAAWKAQVPALFLLVTV